MTEEEIKKEVKIIDAYSKKLLSEPEKAKAFFESIGIFIEKGLDKF